MHEIRELIIRMAEGNPSWATPGSRVHSNTSTIAWPAVRLPAGSSSRRRGPIASWSGISRCSSWISPRAEYERACGAIRAIDPVGVPGSDDLPWSSLSRERHFRVRCALSRRAEPSGAGERDREQGTGAAGGHPNRVFGHYGGRSREAPHRASKVSVSIAP